MGYRDNTRVLVERHTTSSYRQPKSALGYVPRLRLPELVSDELGDGRAARTPTRHFAQRTSRARYSARFSRMRETVVSC